MCQEESSAEEQYGVVVLRSIALNQTDYENISTYFAEGRLVAI